MLIPYKSPMGGHVQGQPAHVVECLSWADFIRASQAGVPNHGVGHNDEWHGGSYKQALALARHGWPEGMKLIRNVALPKVETIASRLADESRWTWDVTGANYEVGEYLSGVPECWQSPRTITQKPVINLTVNMCVSGGVDASAIRARGGAVVALTLALEAAGYLVDTAIIAPMRGKEQDVWVRVHLTDQNGGPMDVDRMLYAMSHESVLRHHMFSIVHGLTGTDYVKWGVNDAPEAWQDDSPGLYIGHAFLTDAKWDDPRAVSKWVDDQFDALTSTT